MGRRDSPLNLVSPLPW